VVYLYMDTGKTEEAMAEFRFTLLDEHSRESKMMFYQLQEYNKSRYHNQ